MGADCERAQLIAEYARLPTEEWIGVLEDSEGEFWDRVFEYGDETLPEEIARERDRLRAGSPDVG